jgi:hypothetical protein
MQPMPVRSRWRRINPPGAFFHSQTPGEIVGLRVRSRCNRFKSVPTVVVDLNRTGDSRGTMDKRTLTERDICTKFILPAVKRAGWDEMVQLREGRALHLMRVRNG